MSNQNMPKTTQTTRYSLFNS